MIHKTLVFLAGLLALACGDRRAEEQGAAPGMEAMPGMGAMRMQSDSLMPRMRMHLDSLVAMAGQVAPGMLSAHEALASEMLDAMGSDMTMMNMRPDSAWTALADSVKRDLADLPALSGRSLEARLRAHVERMRRLLAIHEQMM